MIRTRLKEVDAGVNHIVKGLIAFIKIGLEMIGEQDISQELEDETVDGILNRLHMIEDYENDFNIHFTDEEYEIIKAARTLRYEENK